MERTAKGKDFEVILMIKMETRHPVEGQFGSEYLAICNHCGVMTACNRFQMSSKSVHFRQSYSQTYEGRSFAP